MACPRSPSSSGGPEMALIETVNAVQTAAEFFETGDDDQAVALAGDLRFVARLLQVMTAEDFDALEERARLGDIEDEPAPATHHITVLFAFTADDEHVELERDAFTRRIEAIAEAEECYVEIHHERLIGDDDYGPGVWYGPESA